MTIDEELAEPGILGTAEPGTAEPGTLEPRTVEPRTVAPRTVDEDLAEPGILGTAEPGTLERTVGPTATRPAFVRPAKPEDEARLGRLRERAFDDLGGARGWTMYRERNAAELPPLDAGGSTATRTVWLGGLGNVEFGYLLAAVVPLPSGGTLGVIEAIYVEPGARACGIGEAMTGVALDWFRSRGCVGVEATALPGERATKNFFEEHGLKTRLLTVYRSLTDD